MNSRRVYEAVVDSLVDNGVASVFTLLSEDIARMVDRLRTAGVKVYGTRHEHTAVGMADGYYRASGEPGVAIIGRGPAFAQALAALVNVRKSSSGVVVLVGAGPVAAERKEAEDNSREGKQIQQQAVLDAIEIPHITLASPDSAVADLEAALAFARSGRPIVVNLPVDVLDEMSGSGRQLAAFPATSREFGMSPDMDDIRTVADLLEATFAVRNPVVIAGRGAVQASARDDLIAIADRIGALLATSVHAQHLFEGHPFDIGVVGTFSTDVAIELLARADLVLAFGATLNDYTTYGGDLFPNARVVHFDHDAAAFNRFTPVELSVLGDVGIAAESLRAELERRDHRDEGFRTEAVTRTLSEPQPAPRFSSQGPTDRLDPNEFFARLDAVLPAQRQIVIDGGLHLLTGIRHLSVQRPQDFIFPIEFLSVGVGLGIAMGAAVARPDVVTVLEIGDGGLMMCLGDIYTAVVHDLPLVVAVCNDGAYGAEVQYLKTVGLEVDIALLRNPSFEAVASAMEFEAVTVRTPEDITALGPRLGERAGPLLIDGLVRHDVHIDSYEFAYRTVSGSSSRSS